MIFAEHLRSICGAVAEQNVSSCDYYYNQVWYGSQIWKKCCRDTQKVVFQDFGLAIYDFSGKKWAPDFDDVLRSICGASGGFWRPFKDVTASHCNAVKNSFLEIGKYQGTERGRSRSGAGAEQKMVYFFLDHLNPPKPMHRPQKYT